MQHLPKFLALGLFLAAPTAFAADVQLQSDGTVHELRTRIEAETASVGQGLSAQGRQATQASMSRFFQWVDGYCSVTAGAGAGAVGGVGSGPGGESGIVGGTGGGFGAGAVDGVESTCVHNEYYNYLARIPGSVYRVGGQTVYETGVYAALWPDGGSEALQGADLGRPYTWSLRVIWPRIDAAHSPALGRPFNALSGVVHSMMSDWVTSGWETYADVHLEALDACYLSARITASVYGGGAHPYSTSRVFNWNRLANRALENTDLFKADTDWQAGIAGLYRQHLKALPGAAEYAAAAADQELRTWVAKGYVVTEDGLRIPGHEGRFHAESVPDVGFSWDELAPWLVPSAKCAAQPSHSEASPR